MNKMKVIGAPQKTTSNGLPLLCPITRGAFFGSSKKGPCAPAPPFSDFEFEDVERLG